MQPHRKLIATDVASLFQLISVLSIVIRAKGYYSEACIYTSQSILDQLLVNQYDLHGTNVLFYSTNENHGFSSYKYLIKGLFRKCIHKIDFCHHTYFKPTSILYIGELKEAVNTSAIRFEEGIGSYGTLSHHIHAARRERRRFATFKFVGRQVLKMLCKSQFAVLDKVEAEDAQYFKEASLILTSSLINFTCKCNLQDGKQVERILLTTSPYVDYYGLSELDYSTYLLNISKKFKGKDLYIKPHPLERRSLDIYKELGLRVLSKEIPAESYICSEQYTIVAGSYSTALLVAKNVFNIQVALVPEPPSLQQPKLHSSILRLFRNIPSL